MDRRDLLLTPLLAPLLSAGVLGRGAVAAGPLAVVASFTVLADLVRSVGGGAVAVRSIVGPGGDPHGFQPRPSDLVGLGAAAAIVVNGLGLDGWMKRFAASSGFRGREIVASAGITTRPLPGGAKSGVDPHVWQDPRNAAQMVRTIGAGLAAIDPAGADGYRDRAAALAEDILKEDAAIAAAIGAIAPERRRIITSHDAFGYYGARYGIVFRAPQGISTEGEPTARDLARLVAQMRREGIRAVFIESMADTRIAETLAREAGAVVGGTVYSDSLSAPDGPAATYLAMLRHNTAAFVSAMG